MLDPEHQKKILSDIKAHGCHVIHVLGDGCCCAEAVPSFTYSVGIQRSLRAPELIILDVCPDIAVGVINLYCERVRRGQSFVPGTRYGGFHPSFDVLFLPVHRRYHREFLLGNCWLYDGEAFDALQLVYPDAAGVWPWEEGAPAWLREGQPLLTADGRVGPVALTDAGPTAKPPPGSAPPGAA